MSLIALMWSPGRRTITLSVIAGVLAVLIQADSQGIIPLAPMLKIVISLLFTIVTPMIPIYIRKALTSGLEAGAKK